MAGAKNTKFCVVCTHIYRTTYPYHHCCASGYFIATETQTLWGLPQGGWGRRIHSESLKKHLEQKCIQWFPTNALIST